MPRARLILTAVLLTLAAAAPAAAAPPGAIFNGATSDDNRIAVVHGADGLVQEVRARWQAACRDNGTVSSSRGFAIRPARKDVTADRFSIDDTARTRQRGGFRLTTRYVLRAVRDTLAGERWRGTVSVDVTVRRRGKVVTRCSSPQAVWGARLGKLPENPSELASNGSVSWSPAWTWAFTVTVADVEPPFPTGTWTLTPGPSTANGIGTKAGLSFEARQVADEPWRIALRAPRTEKALTPGRTSPVGPGGVRVQFEPQDGRACAMHETTGAVTLQALTLDARGRATRFAFTFDLACPSGGTYRGAIDFTST